jgi:hypothetical protein
MEKLVLSSGHAAPDHPEARGVGIPEGSDIGDAGPLKAFRHVGADARDGARLK